MFLDFMVRTKYSLHSFRSFKPRFYGIKSNRFPSFSPFCFSSLPSTTSVLYFTKVVLVHYQSFSITTPFLKYRKVTKPLIVLPSPIVIYTDASYLLNNAPDHAGIGVWISNDHQCNLSLPFQSLCKDERPTSCTAELLAVTVALRLFKNRPIEIRTDSSYVLTGYEKWKSLFLTTQDQKKKMINKEYFDDLHAAFQARKGNVIIHHTPRNHPGIRQAHILAALAANVSFWQSLPPSSTQPPS